MQPFEYVILFFGICLLHGLLRAFYETGITDASPENHVFIKSIQDLPDPNFVENMVKYLNREIEISTDEVTS